VLEAGERGARSLDVTRGRRTEAPAPVSHARRPLRPSQRPAPGTSVPDLICCHTGLLGRHTSTAQGFRRKMAPLVARAYQIIDEQSEQRRRGREVECLTGNMSEKEGTLIDAIKGMFTVHFTNAIVTS
jgi:hypothetical protein